MHTKFGTRDHQGITHVVTGITHVKDTSLANTIANREIIMMAKEYSAKGLIWPLFSTALFFLVFVGALTILFNWAEKKLDYFRC